MPTGVGVQPALAGVDETSPRIAQVTPAPGRFIVDNIGLQTVAIVFTEAVNLPDGAVTVWTINGGQIAGFATSFDAGTNELTLTFDSPIRDDRAVFVVDYTIT